MAHRHHLRNQGGRKESRRLTQLTPAEIAAMPRGTAVRLRMRLARKKDGRFKARLLVQGFLEPITWDVGVAYCFTCLSSFSPVHAWLQT